MRAFLFALALLFSACQTSTEPLNEAAPIVASTPPEASGETPVDTTDYMPTRLVSDAMMAEAEVVAEGTFSGTDRHDAVGRALLIRLDDGSLVVRLEGLDVDNGPDLRVHVIRNLADNTYPPVDLGDLKSTRGDQNYAVPADAGLDTTQPLGISIWCRAFSIGFGTAALR